MTNFALCGDEVRTVARSATRGKGESCLINVLTVSCACNAVDGAGPTAGIAGPAADITVPAAGIAGPAVGRDGAAVGRDGHAVGRDGPALGRDGPSVGRDGPALGVVYRQGVITRDRSPIFPMLNQPQ